MARRIAIIAIVLGIGGLWLASHQPPGLGETILIHLSVSAIELGTGVFIVNVILHKRAKAEVAGALMLFSHSALEFTRVFSTHLRQELGLTCVERIQAEFQGALARVDVEVHNALALPDCEAVTKVYLKHREELGDILAVLEDNLRDLTNILGWGYDANVFSYCVRARHAIRALGAAGSTTTVDNRMLCAAALETYESVDEIVSRLAKLVPRALGEHSR